MANSEVLLLKPVDGLGAEGDRVKVRAGYARNFLLPKKIGVPITASNKKQIEVLKKRRIERETQELDGAKALAAQLEKTNIAFAVKTGEGGKMFGSVTASDIQTLAFPVLRHRILLNYRAEAEGVRVEDVIKRLLETVKPPVGT